jgi:hypothetical protein
VTHHDELWADMAQFDHEVADGVWDGTTRDPDAPAWYREVLSLIHRAKGPAEPDELVDEPVVVATMHGATLGEKLARIPRSSGVRTLGRVVAMKAAAATTASLVSVAAAAAATTGIVATVAATVVVPAVAEHVVPMIGDRLAPAVAAPSAKFTHEGTAGSHEPSTGESQSDQAETPPVADPVTTEPAEPAPTVEADPAIDAAPAPAEVAPVPEDPATEPATEEPIDPVAAEPEAEEPVEAPVDPATADPPPIDPASTEPAPEETPPAAPGTQTEPEAGSEGGATERFESEAAPLRNSAAHAESEPGPPDHGGKQRGSPPQC